MTDLDNEGYTCVQVVYGEPPRYAVWLVVDRYGVRVPGEPEHTDYVPARKRAEQLNEAVLASRFT